MKLLNCKWLIGAALAVFLVVGCSISAQTPPEDQANTPLIREEGLVSVPDNSPLRKSLQVAAVEEESIERPIIVPGTVEADPATLIKVVPPVSGKILQLHKHLGDVVRKGDALFTLDSADLAQAYSDASKAQAALALAKRNVERQRDLSRAEISARKDLEQAESDYSQAASEAERARTRLSLLGVEPGKGDGRRYTYHSPIAGHVIELTGAQGGFWNDMNAPIMTVADLSKVWLSAGVQEKDISSVFVGQSAKITLNAYESEAFTGNVRYVGAVLDPDTRTIKVRIAINNESGRFRPGMFAKVIFNCRPHKAAVIPVSALLQRGFNTQVFVEKTSWQFEPRIIKTGVQAGDRVEVLSGLNVGERIVVKEGVLLND